MRPAASYDRAFRDAGPEELGSAVAKRNIVDGRNALDR